MFAGPNGYGDHPLAADLLGDQLADAAPKIRAAWEYEKRWAPLRNPFSQPHELGLSPKFESGIVPKICPASIFVRNFKANA